MLIIYSLQWFVHIVLRILYLVFFTYIYEPYQKVRRVLIEYYFNYWFPTVHGRNAPLGFSRSHLMYEWQRVDFPLDVPIEWLYELEVLSLRFEKDFFMHSTSKGWVPALYKGQVARNRFYEIGFYPTNGKKTFRKRYKCSNEYKEAIYNSWKHQLYERELYDRKRYFFFREEDIPFPGSMRYYSEIFGGFSSFVNIELYDHIYKVNILWLFFDVILCFFIILIILFYWSIRTFSFLKREKKVKRKKPRPFVLFNRYAFQNFQTCSIFKNQSLTFFTIVEIFYLRFLYRLFEVNLLGYVCYFFLYVCFYWIVSLYNLILSFDQDWLISCVTFFYFVYCLYSWRRQVIEARKRIEVLLYPSYKLKSIFVGMFFLMWCFYLLNIIARATALYTFPFIFSLAIKHYLWIEAYDEWMGWDQGHEPAHYYVEFRIIYYPKGRVLSHPRYDTNYHTKRKLTFVMVIFICIISLISYFFGIVIFRTFCKYYAPFHNKVFFWKKKKHPYPLEYSLQYHRRRVVESFTNPGMGKKIVEEPWLIIS